MVKMKIKLRHMGELLLRRCADVKSKTSISAHTVIPLTVKSKALLLRLPLTLRTDLSLATRGSISRYET